MQIYATHPIRKLNRLRLISCRAARALFNHMYYEACRMASEQAEGSLISESLLGLPKPALGMTLQDEDNKASS